MSAENPPNPYTPYAFNPNAWNPSASGGIDTAYLDANYLRYKYAQGIENMVGIVNSGALTQVGDSQFDEIPVCSVNYTINPPASDNLITKGYADATYTAGTGTYATLDLDNAFTAVNTFTTPATDTPVLIEGAGSSYPTLTLLKQATDYSMFFLTDAGDGSYGSIVNAGDNVIVSTQGTIDTGALDLMTHTSSVAGIKITPTGEQISGTITGYFPRGGAGAVIPLQFTSAQTSGNNPIADFVPIVPTNSQLSVIADPTAGQFSSQTTLGDLVFTATTTQPVSTQFFTSGIYYTDNTGGGLYPYSMSIVSNPVGIIIGTTTFTAIYTGVSSSGLVQDLTFSDGFYRIYTSTALPVGSGGTLTLYNPIATTEAGAIEICSQGASSLRISPTSINANTPIYTPAIVNAGGIGLNLVTGMPIVPQGAAGTGLLWNQDVGSYGETDFLNYAQLGTGGFVFWNCSSVSAPAIIAKISPSISSSSNDTTLATTAFVQSAISNLSPSFYTLKLPNATLISNITISISKTGGTIIQQDPVIISARLMYGTNYTGVNITSTLDFTATAILTSSSTATGLITQNFNITTAGAPTINITSSSMSVDANQQINFTFVLTTPTTLNFYQVPVVLSNYSLYTTSGYTYGNPVLGYN